MEPASGNPAFKTLDVTDISSVAAHINRLRTPKEVLNFYRFLFSGGADAAGTQLSASNVAKLQNSNLQVTLRHFFTEKNADLLHQAINERDLDVCKDLLIHRVSGAQDKNNEGEPAILIAKRVDDVALARLLFHHGAAQGLSAVQACEILPWLVENSFLDQMLQLIHLGHSFDTEDENGVRPLMLAISEGKISVFDALVDAGANLVQPDKRDFTPMHYCFLLGNSDFIRVLKERSVDPYASIQALPENAQTQNIKNELLSAYQADEEGFFNNQEFLDKLRFLFIVNDLRKGMDRFFTQLNVPLEQGVDQKIEKISQLRPLNNWSELCKTKSRQIKVLNDLRCVGSTTLSSNPSSREGWEQANHFIMQWAEDNEPLTLDKIAQINRIVDPESAGIYRVAGMEASVGTNFVKCYIVGALVSEQMAQFLSPLEDGLTLVKQKQLNPIDFAARSYQFLISIHPFKNGNGRTCRLIADYLLWRCHLPPPAWNTDVNAAVFLYYPKNVSPSKVVLAVYHAVEKSYQILNKGEGHVNPT